ncbi:MAG TPA: type II toxin-antitoxin system prevent-host-death family antitoxin [Rhodocyclaceae bacterium]|nr:type II toxin-antitoxin system prevent-host-death family antitoxin [Rhodocyclaceae bacterium]
MSAYSIAEAKAHLSELLKRAEAGEEVVITRRGEAVVRMAPMKTERKPADWARIDTLRKSMPAMKTNSVDIVRDVREERY